MKTLLITLLFTISVVTAQTYKQVKQFCGVVTQDSIIWNKNQEITGKLTITKNIILIDNKKSFKLIEKLQQTNNETIYYAIDWEKLKCYVIIEDYDEFKYIYFQWSDIIIGYKIIEI